MAKNELLGELLKNVSRSFYLSLRVLPSGLQAPVGLAYLLARAADTIADTQLVPPPQRLELLLAFRTQVKGPAAEQKANRIAGALSSQQADPHERRLLQSLAPALALLEALEEKDRAAVRQVVTVLTTGMEQDLAIFPLETSGQLAALQTPADLDRYIYLVAGCVGEFWTKITIAHIPALRGWNEPVMSACGIRFGKALQMTNVLRDCPKDLRNGRCYLPRERLQAYGLTPEDLLKPENSARARPLLLELLRVTQGHYQEARRYILALPRRCLRLRLACLWPVVIGLGTLERLAKTKNWLDPAQRVMVPQGEVNRMLVLAPLTVWSNTLARRWMRKIECGIADPEIDGR
jgi:farnesyl-diphosphate farnesyltransferase